MQDNFVIDGSSSRKGMKNSMLPLNQTLPTSPVMRYSHGFQRSEIISSVLIVKKRLEG